MKCEHSLAEKDTEVADGGCPICLAQDKYELILLLQEVYDEGYGDSKIRMSINAILVRMR